MSQPTLDELYTFDEVLKRLNISENRLKLLVSEGEFRVWRANRQMWFEKKQVDALAGPTPPAQSSSAQISIEDDLSEEEVP